MLTGYPRENACYQVRMVVALPNKSDVCTCVRKRKVPWVQWRPQPYRQSVAILPEGHHLPLADLLADRHSPSQSPRGRRQDLGEDKGIREDPNRR